MRPSHRRCQQHLRKGRAPSSQSRGRPCVRSLRLRSQSTATTRGTGNGSHMSAADAGACAKACGDLHAQHARARRSAARTTIWKRVGGTRKKPNCRIGKEPTLTQRKLSRTFRRMREKASTTSPTHAHGSQRRTSEPNRRTRTTTPRTGKVEQELTTAPQNVRRPSLCTSWKPNHPAASVSKQASY